MRRASLVVMFFAVHCNKADAVLADAGATSVATTSAPAASAPPARTTDYASMTEAKNDREHSRGKTVMLYAMREKLMPDRVTLIGCSDTPVLDFAWFRAKYSPEARPLLRGLPAYLKGDCKHVIVRYEPADGLDGEVIEVLDARPALPVTPPPGVDFASSDDIMLAGKAAAGKVARLMVRRQSSGNGVKTAVLPSFVATPCDVYTAGIEVRFRPQQQAFVDAIADQETGSCTEITVKLTKLLNASDGIWLAQLMAP